MQIFIQVSQFNFMTATKKTRQTSFSWFNSYTDLILFIDNDGNLFEELMGHEKVLIHSGGFSPREDAFPLRPFMRTFVGNTFKIVRGWLSDVWVSGFGRSCTGHP